MGNKSSRPVDDFAELIHNGKTPPGEPEQTYSKEKIEEGLKVVAKYLASKKLNVAIVTVGGAVNTVLLKSRASTGDVDFFYRTKASGSKESNLVHEVVEGGKLAEKELKLGSQWLNNHTVVFIEEHIIHDLYDDAVAQNEKVFSANGLTVYAAPWNYALMAKLDRAGKPGAKSYDITDAVDYLDRLIKSRHGHAVKKSELKAWATKFKLAAPTEAVIDRLDKLYKQKHGKDGIVGG
jgi:hypothetical protein